MSSGNECGNWTCDEPFDVHVRLSPYPPWLVIFLWLLTALLSVATILGNLLVLLAYKLERNIRRQLSNKFIVSLAVTDLIIGMEGFPLLTVYVVGRERWPLGHLLCQFWLFLDYTLCLVSILNVLLITIDRYGSVCYPAKYRIWQNRSRVRLFIFMSWIVPCVLFGMMIFAWEHMTGQGMDDSGKCYAPFLNDPYVNMAMYIIYYWTTLVAMSVLYRGIHTAAKALEDKSKARERQTIALLLGQRCMAQVGVGMLLHSSASDEDEENIESFFHPRPTVTDHGDRDRDQSMALITDSLITDYAVASSATMSNTVANNLIQGGYEQLREDEMMTGTSDSDERTPLNVAIPRVGILAPASVSLGSIRTAESPSKERNGNFLRMRLLYCEFGEGEDEEDDVAVSLLPLIDRSESKLSKMTGAAGTSSTSPTSIFDGCPTRTNTFDSFQGGVNSRRTSGARRILSPIASYGGGIDRFDRSESKLSTMTGAAGTSSTSPTSIFDGCPTRTNTFDSFQGGVNSRRTSGARRILAPIASYGGVATIASATGTNKLIGSPSLDEKKSFYAIRRQSSQFAPEQANRKEVERKLSNNNSISHDSACSLEFYDSKKGSFGSLYGDPSLHSVFEFGCLVPATNVDKEEVLITSAPDSMNSSMISSAWKARQNGDLPKSSTLKGSLTGSSISSISTSKPRANSGSDSLRSRLSAKSEVDRRSSGDYISISSSVVPSVSSPAKLIHLADDSEDGSTTKTSSPRSNTSQPASARPSVQIMISADTELTPIIEEDKSSGATNTPSQPNPFAPFASVDLPRRRSSSGSNSSGAGKTKKRNRANQRVDHLKVPGSSSASRYGLRFMSRRRKASSASSVVSKKGARARRDTETGESNWQRASMQSMASSIYDDFPTNDKRSKSRRLTRTSNIDDDEDSCASGNANRVESGPGSRAGSRAEDGPITNAKGNNWLMNLFTNPTSILNRKRKVTKAERRARKAFRTITVIVGTFALFWSPYYIVATIYGFCPDCVPAPLFLTSYYLCYLNSSVNPFAYAFANRLFRKTFIRILRGDLRRT